MAPTVRTLDQILSEIGGVYTPQIQSLQTQMADIPNQVQAEEQGLAAKQTNAFGDILNSARRRGTGVAFGGIPLQEQAQYTASTYMPALANLRTAAKQQATSLQDAINQIQERRQNAALSLQQTDQQRYDTYQQNQQALAAQRAAAAASDISKYFNTGTASTANSQAATPTQGAYTYKNGSNGSGGFAFYDAGNNPISAAKYAQLNGIKLLDLINKMAKAGDTGAASILKGPGVDTNSLNYKRYFAWDIPSAGSGGGGGGGGGW